MQEVLTRSGAVIRYDNPTPGLIAAISSLGGKVVTAQYDEPREVVLTIMDQMVVGTTLTDSKGTVYTLFHDDWTTPSGDTVKMPPYDDIVSATMPGGWSWVK